LSTVTLLRIARQNPVSQAHQHAATLVVLHEVATEAATAELLLPVLAVVDVKSTSPTFVHLHPLGI
jgi:hypothetical protein